MGLKFGRNTDIDSAAAEDITDIGGVYPWTPDGDEGEITVKSTSANDKIAGSGVRKVKVYGTRRDFTEIVEEVEMDGVTPVAIPNIDDGYRIHRVWASDVDPAGAGVAAGDIEVIINAVTRAKILTGKNETNMAIYTVPKDRRLEITYWYAAALRATPAAALVDLSLYVRPPTILNVSYKLEQDMMSLRIPDAPFDDKSYDKIKLAFGAGYDIWINAAVSVDNCDIMSTFNYNVI